MDNNNQWSYLKNGGGSPLKIELSHNSPKKVALHAEALATAMTREMGEMFSELYNKGTRESQKEFIWGGFNLAVLDIDKNINKSLFLATLPVTLADRLELTKALTDYDGNDQVVIKDEKQLHLILEGPMALHRMQYRFVKHLLAPTKPPN